MKILLGKDKGREGKVERLFLKKGTALVPGLNIYKRRIKAANAADKKGGVYEIPRPFKASKLGLVCPNCKKATRVSFKMEGERKVRICAKCKKVIDGKGKINNK